jgi:serine/threonine protein kinase
LLTPGEKLFEYEIISQLGKSSFAVVYAAHDRMLDRQVAIKHLLPNRAASAKAVKRFVQEARVAAALEHPNIVEIHALRAQEKNLYIVMEYLPGGSLRQWLDRQGSLPIEQAIRLTIGICEGLAKLHTKGIIHRDIKAENILLAADDRPKITDFGIAHVPKSAGGMDLTSAGFQPGTLLYNSPEQFRGEKLDQRSDVYQVGALLYYLLTGRHYIDLNALETQAKTLGGSNPIRSQALLLSLLEGAICQEMPEGLARLWRKVGALAGVVGQAMAKELPDRFKDTTELVTALNAISISTAPSSTHADKDALRNSRAYNKRGLAHASTRNYEQAIHEYTRAIELGPLYAEAYNNRGSAYLILGSYRQAILDFSRALDLVPDFVAATINRGIAYTAWENYERALADFNQAIALNAKNIYAYYNRGNTRVRMGHFKEALDDYDRAIELDGEFVAAYVNRGVVQNRLMHYQEAIADYNQAIALNPDEISAHYNRANACRALEQYLEAITDYGKVIELNPKHPYAYQHRADVYRIIGDHERAAADQASAANCKPPTIDPQQLSLARSMLMPATPLDLVTEEQGE